ncbi:hypothetical protein ACFO1B_17115 [Dactylosporangium siamense]|uniref:Uncharacterized protein n=1 Tax=Dactylosporangium siamense TaxID=685454 RepID=A0A919PLS3_9ACTN|nr:hypothetical protein [Dactylosporangium siamense]GIG45561.1 hypothetical protein Dsi01nite_036020 [Dactylosporangium siamense]
MLIVQGTAPYPWGLLVVSDAGSTFQELPEQLPPGWQFVAARDAVVFSVEHRQIADVTVRVWRDQLGHDGGRAPISSVQLTVASGRLVVGDVERSPEITMYVEQEPGICLIDAYFDVPLAPETVDLVIRPA